MPKLKPPTDLSFDLGASNARWKNGYFQNISDGQAAISLADMAAQHAFLKGKGAVTQNLTLYIRTDGNDNNNGLSAAKALKTPARATEMVDTKYLGFIRNLTFDFGTGVFDGEWNTPQKTALGRFGIVGAGIDSTTIAMQGRLNFSDSIAALQQYRFSGLTFRRKANPTPGSSFVHVATPNVSYSNICLDHTETGAGVGGIVFDIGAVNAKFSGNIKFKGNFNTCISCNSNAPGVQIQFDANTSIAFENLSASQIFACYGTHAVNLYNSAAPTYTNATASYFARLTQGARMIIRSSALNTAWHNGWNDAIDGTSQIAIA